MARGVSPANSKRRGSRKSQASKDGREAEEGLDKVKERARKRVDQYEKTLVDMASWLHQRYLRACELDDVDGVLRLQKAVSTAMAADMKLAQKRLVGRPKKEEGPGARASEEERERALDQYAAG